MGASKQGKKGVSIRTNCKARQFVSHPQFNLIYTTDYGKSQSMGVPAKLTEKQIKFAELLVYNEGRMSPAECAKEAGYTTRPRQAASELRNPKYSPLVVRYIGEYFIFTCS